MMVGYSTDIPKIGFLHKHMYSSCRVLCTVFLTVVIHDNNHCTWFHSEITKEENAFSMLIKIKKY